MSITKFGSLTAAFALALGLAACSSEEAEQNVEDAQTAVSETVDDASSAIDDAPSDDTTDSGSGGATDGGSVSATDRSVEGAKAAREVALSVVAEAGDTDGVVVSQDWDDDGYWQIDVVAGNTKHELDVRGDQVTERETDDVDDADTAAASAPVTIDEAIETALKAQPGELDDASYSDGRWEVEIDTATEDDVEVHVDATTGEIAG